MAVVGAAEVLVVGAEVLVVGAKVLVVVKVFALKHHGRLWPWLVGCQQQPADSHIHFR